VEEEHPVTHLRAARTTKVRYGRARLTVKRRGDVSGGEVGEAISAFARGEMNANRLAWTFVRDRVQAASPSFDWRDADLDRVVKLVVAESAEPRLTSADPEALAAELVASAGTSRASIGEAAATVRKLSLRGLASVRGRLGPLSGYEEIMGALRGGLFHPLRTARAIGDSLLGRVTGLSVDRTGVARERLWGILGDSYGRLRGRRTY
jgi:hypothetical protein